MRDKNRGGTNPPQDNTDSRRSASRNLWRFLVTFAALVVAAFGMAYLIGTGVFDIGGTVLSFLVTVVVCTVLVYLGARALTPR